MIITRNELNKSKSKIFDFKLDYKNEDLKDIYLRRLEDIKAKFYFKFNLNDELMARVVVSGVMICPCAITNEDVDLILNIDEEIIFNDVDDITYGFENEINIKDVVYSLISKEIPIKVVKSGEIEYPKGNGWQVIKESDLIKHKQAKTDLRWDKLKNFKSDKED